MNWLPRFWAKVYKPSIHQCWDWLSYIDPDGYSRFQIKNVSYGAHRLSWKEFFGEIPKDMVIDHKCRNRSCVNPYHMQLVTRGENVLLGIGMSAINKAKTHCLKNHPFDSKNNRGDRVCSICKNASLRNWYEINKQEVNKKRRSRHTIAKAEGGK